MEDDSQTRAIEADITAPLLVEAGPGSGKTFTVIRRAQYILEKTLSCAADPSNCLGLALITFSNNAAAEMRNRLVKLLNLSMLPKHICVATFHSYALRLIRKYHIKLGYTQSPDIISSRKDRLAILVEVLRDKQYAAILEKTTEDEAKNKYLNFLLEQIRQAKMEQDFNKTVSLFDNAGIPISLFEHFQREMTARNQIMFDDMLMFGLKLLGEPDILSNVSNCHRHFLVDEFQDTNSLQLAFLKKIFNEHKVMFTIVGDVDQLIYRYIGAQKANFNAISLIAEARGLVPTMVKLKCNYRSTDKIVKVCNELVDADREDGRKKAMINAMEMWGIEDGSSQPVKLVSCPDALREKECVLCTILSLVSGSYGGPALLYEDICVLYRLNEQGRELREYLSGKMPFVKFITKVSSANPSGDQDCYCGPAIQLFIGKLRMAMSGSANAEALAVYRPSFSNRDFDRFFGDILPSVKANAQRANRHLLDAFLDMLTSSMKQQKKAYLTIKEKNVLKRWCEDVKAIENAIAINDLSFLDLCYKAISDKCLKEMSTSDTAYLDTAAQGVENDEIGDAHFQRCVTSFAIAYNDSAAAGTSTLDKLDGFLSLLRGLSDRTEGFLFLELGLKEFSKGGSAAADCCGSGSSSNMSRLTLSTIHKAKGLEWKAVILYHASSDCFGGTSSRVSNDPSDQLAAEEDDTNLLYVAMSRPTRALFVTHLDDAQTTITHLLKPVLRLGNALVVREQFLGSDGGELAALRTVTALAAGSYSGQGYTSHSKKRKF